LRFCGITAELEFEASAEQPSQLSMSDHDVQFCLYMVNKYGDNYVVSFVVAKYVSDGDDVDYFIQCP